MIVEVTSAATSRRVAHLEAVKRDLGITDTSEDANILQAIDIVSGEFGRVLGRAPWMQTYLVRQPGDGGTFLRVPVWPLVTVSQVRQGVDSPTVVDATAYEIAEPPGAQRQDRLYRSDGWAESGSPSRIQTSADERPLTYEITCVAGWATPIDDWAADTLVRVGEFARSSDRDVALRFEATAVAGDGKTHASTEPTWPTTAGDTVIDDQVTWTAREAVEMPANLWGAAMWSVNCIFQNPDLIAAQPAGVEEMAGGGMRIKWAKGGNGSGSATASILPAVSLRQVELYA